MTARRKFQRRGELLQKKINREVERQVSLLPMPEQVQIYVVAPSFWERIKTWWRWLRTWG